MNFLEGYKVYIISLIGIIIAVLSQIFLWFPTETNLEILWMCFLAAGLRRGIETK